MTALTPRQQKAALRRETASWQLGAIGLLVVSVAVNMGMIARITSLEQAREADAVRYRAQIESAEHTRELAVEQLGEMVLQAEADKQARAELAAAYEMIGAYRYVGECTITAYCPCSECCGRWADGLTATGLPAGPGIVAVDESVIPIGSTVIIDGQCYLAADTGVSGFCIDIAMSDHQSAINCGVKNENVWIIPPDKEVE